MNLPSIIPLDYLQTMITNAILEGLRSPTKTPPIDVVPYQLYAMAHQPGGFQGPVPHQVGVCQTPTVPTIPSPPMPRINTNIPMY